MKNGDLEKVCVNIGDKVWLPEYGG